MDVKQGADSRTSWGRVKFSGKNIPAMLIAIPAGLLLGIAVGTLTLLTDFSQGQSPLLIALVFALITSGAFIALVWALIVDRTTLRGAIDRPEESAESRWLENAMSGAMGDTVALAGVGVFILALTGIELNAIWALTGIVLFAFLSSGIRYLVAKKRA